MGALILVVLFFGTIIIYYILEFILRLFGKSFNDPKKKTYSKIAYLAAGGTEEDFLNWWKKNKTK